MRTVSITEFRANMVKELADLPFALTRDGKKVAEVCTEPVLKVCTEPSKKVIPIKKSVQIKESVHAVDKSDQFFKPLPKKGKK